MQTMKNVIGITVVLIAIAGAIPLHAQPKPGANAGVRRTPEHRIPRSPFIVRACHDRFGSRTCLPGPYVSLSFPVLRENELGGVRLLVEPAGAEVYVNGTYVGHVQDFSKPSNRLDLTPGSHRIEIRAPGYEPLDFETRIYGGQTTPFHGTLVRK